MVTENFEKIVFLQASSASKQDILLRRIHNNMLRTKHPNSKSRHIEKLNKLYRIAVKVILRHNNRLLPVNPIQTPNPPTFTRTIERVGKRSREQQIKIKQCIKE
jgi:hypothetical protein